MPNNWTYCLELSPERPFSRQSLERALEIVQEYGYAPSFPGVLIELGGGAGLEYRTLDAVQNHLFLNGGAIVLWSHEDNLHLCATPKSNRIEIGVLHELYPDRPSDVRVAADLHTIFLALCNELHPFYAYSSDDWRVEAAVQGEDILRVWREFEEGIRKGEKPRFLFWLNYFSADYLSRIGAAPFADIDHTTRQHSHGMVVQLSAYPWEAEVKRLGSDGRYHTA